jgi:hypothetical protein
MTTRRIAIWTMALLTLAAVLWTGWWFYAGRFAIASLQEWAEEQRANGYDVTFARVDMAGYPFRIDLTVRRFGISAPGRFWAVSSDETTVSFRPWNLNRYTLKTAAPVQMIAAALPGTRQSPIVAGSVEGTFHHARDGQTHVLELVAKPISGPLGLSVKEVGLIGERPARRATDHEATALSGRLELVDAAAPALFPPGLPNRVTAAVLDFDVLGPEPGQHGSALRRLSEWRDGGGSIEVREIALAWEDLNLRGEGTLALDSDMRPIAAFALDASGVPQTARRFQEAGLIDDRTRRYIELGTGLLSLGRSNSASIRVPISAQDGILYVGPVAVGEVQPLIPGYNPAPAAVAPPPKDDFAPPPPPPTVSEETLGADTPPRPVPVPVPVPSQ